VWLNGHARDLRHTQHHDQFVDEVLEFVDAG
jgi:hypothetical protein